MPYKKWPKERQAAYMRSYRAKQKAFFIQMQKELKQLRAQVKLRKSLSSTNLISGNIRRLRKPKR